MLSVLIILYKLPTIVGTSGIIGLGNHLMVSSSSFDCGKNSVGRGEPRRSANPDTCNKPNSPVEISHWQNQ